MMDDDEPSTAGGLPAVGLPAVTLPAVTLGDVLAQPDLDLAAVVPGEPSLVVRSAHSSEIDDPGRWLEPESVMLTTGLRLVGVETDGETARRLVEGLKRARVVALFFGVGVNFSHVPAALVAACRAAGLPLYEVGAEVPFYRVENYINASAGAPEAYQLRRAVRLTNELVDSLSSEEPTKALVARLASLARGTAVLYGPTGRTVESTGAGPLQLICAELQQRRWSGPAFEIGRWTVMGRSVALRGNMYIIAIASRTPGAVVELGPMLLETAQRLLGGINAINRLAVSRQRHEGVQLLTDLQDGIPLGREQRYWERLEPFLFRPFAPVRALVARSVDGRALDGGAIQSLLEGAEKQTLGLLLAESGRSPAAPPGFTALVADGPGLEPWTAAASSRASLGLSEPFTDLSAAPDAFGEAEAAAEIAVERLGVGAQGSTGLGAVVKIDDVDPASWLLARRRSRRDRDKVARYAAPLRRDPELVATIVRYLARGMDVAATAGDLFVHGNTVRYRLRKAEDLLGGSLTDAAVVANLYLSLRAEIEGAKHESAQREDQQREKPVGEPD
ncbi:PucR family transcriptional regulator ligand-binding domain-containing protein [Sinomonas atrocyanea]|uniref:PucR family transcriptional regulator n=1 Tax=Sinomonas atrocyanea TaxID=37927 RepID=UPI003D9847B1